MVASQARRCVGAAQGLQSVSADADAILDGLTGGRKGTAANLHLWALTANDGLSARRRPLAPAAGELGRGARLVPCGSAPAVLRL